MAEPEQWAKAVWRALARLLRGALMVVAVLSLVCGTSTAQSQQELDDREAAKGKLPDRENGTVVARTLCASCHLLGEEAADAVIPADVPSFPSIANRPGQTANALAIWLMKPHAPMPDLHLTQKEIRDISAYILSLRSSP